MCNGGKNKKPRFAKVLGPKLFNKEEFKLEKLLVFLSK